MDEIRYLVDNALGFTPGALAIQTDGKTATLQQSASDPNYTLHTGLGHNVITISGDHQHIESGAGDDTLTYTGPLVGNSSAWYAGDGNDHLTLDLSTETNNIYTSYYNGDLRNGAIGYGNDGYGDPSTGFGFHDVESLTITTGSGNDNLTGGNGDDILSGGAGNDILTGGTGTDLLSGGSGDDVFKGTTAGLNGNTITDFGAGDRIRITDANPVNFSFSLNGTALTYAGGSLTLQGLAGDAHLRATAATGGGVDLMLYSRTVRNDFNGDGHADVLWRNDNGSLTDWLGRADGSFTANTAPPLRTCLPVGKWPTSPT